MDIDGFIIFKKKEGNMNLVKRMQQLEIGMSNVKSWDIGLFERLLSDRLGISVTNVVPDTKSSVHHDDLDFHVRKSQSMYETVENASGAIRELIHRNNYYGRANLVAVKVTSIDDLYVRGYFYILRSTPRPWTMNEMKEAVYSYYGYCDDDLDRLKESDVQIHRTWGSIWMNENTFDSAMNWVTEIMDKVIREGKENKREVLAMEVKQVCYNPWETHCHVIAYTRRYPYIQSNI